MIRISLCMIVKDEEAVLERILEQMKDIADEIIIVDTGSSDSTKDIAQKYTARVFDYEWHDDFAAARNFACSKASMDYWMWLDADDVVTSENQKKIKELKETLDPSIDVVMMKYLAGFGEDGAANFSYYRERLIKNKKGFLWEGRVHEAVTPRGKIIHSDIEIEHRKMVSADADRNLRIYQSIIAEGQSLEPRHQFYYGRELYYHGKYDEALSVFEEFLKSSEGWRENKIDACMQTALCYEKIGDSEHRLNSLLNSFKYDTPRAEVCCEIGRFFMEQKTFEIAVYWYEQALTVPDKSQEGGFEQKEYHDYIPLIQLCVCYDRLGDHYKAWQYHLRTTSLKPKADAVLKNQKYFERLFSES